MHVMTVWESIFYFIKLAAEETRSSITNEHIVSVILLYSESVFTASPFHVHTSLLKSNQELIKLRAIHSKFCIHAFLNGWNDM